MPGSLRKKAEAINKRLKREVVTDLKSESR